MTLIRALPDEYSNFASSLLLLDKLDKATVHQAFVTEEAQRRHRANEAPTISAALATSPAPSGPQKCEFCTMTGHTIETCYKYRDSKREAQESVQKRQNKRKGQ